MARWIVELTDRAEQELETLPADIQARFLRTAALIEVAGPSKVGMPHVRHLEGKLWEMRLHGRDGIARAIYFSASGRRCRVVRVFTKKTQTTPRSEIDLALKRMVELDHEDSEGSES